jgi:osmotically-inducible protein OsmY
VNRSVVLVALVLVLAGCANVQEKLPASLNTRPATEVLRDAFILAAVKAKLTAGDPDSTTTLDVSVYDRIVTLSGTVRDNAAHQRDVAAAKSVSGVRLVVDEVSVDAAGPRPGQALGDAALATRIAAAYTAQVGLQHVTVHAHKGVVTLDGKGSTVKTKDAIVTAAHDTTGVHEVIDHISVSGS